MIRPIVKFGDHVLHHEAARVTDITADIAALVRDMIETMYAAPGVGLAAPQVGVPLRVFVVDVSGGRSKDGLMAFVNPEFVEREGMQLEEEGCLSRAGVQRHRREADPRRREGPRPRGPRARSWRARGCWPGRFQHEMDHLDGRVFVDRLRGIQRDLIVRRIRKLIAFREVVMAGAPLRLVFFGTPDFAVPSLDALLRSRHAVVGAVTQPDRPRGRGQHVTDSPVKQAAVARRRAGAAAGPAERRGIPGRAARVARGRSAWWRPTARSSRRRCSPRLPPA